MINGRVMLMQHQRDIPPFKSDLMEGSVFKTMIYNLIAQSSKQFENKNVYKFAFEIQK